MIFKKINGVFLLFSLSLFLGGCESPQRVNRFTGQTMGTFYTVSIDAPDMDEAHRLQIHDSIDSVLHAINKQMNLWDPESEISHFNQMSSDDTLTISSDFARVIHLSKTIWETSKGAFDPTVGPLVDLWGFGAGSTEKKVPDSLEIARCLEYVGFDLIGFDENKLYKKDSRVHLDLAAIAKGYGVDAVADYLKNRGFENCLVEIGGEVYASGTVKGRPWRLGIERPVDNAMPGDAINLIISVSNQGVATSGDYRNYYIHEGRRISHTLDPKTGYPVNHILSSATIIAPTCAEADAIATACIVLGEDAFPWVETLPSIEGYFLFRKDSESFQEKMSSGFHHYIVEK
ncbi:MAG: FAD:protein FMN transferase [Candidatus Marinimicrobia bacterium]|nr:FAD:protein FMN transferase [Candidatus Neomarinimicrobiota bacterium]MDD5582543.1 FAD:protein FMN transferase [Candidatus Neomarinimicrobiota bacterium]